MTSTSLYKLSAGDKFYIEGHSNCIFSYSGRIDGAYGRCDVVEAPNLEETPQEERWTFIAAWTPCIVVGE